MAKKFNWKVWLRINLLTQDVDNDYIAEVSTNKETKRIEDVADRIKDRGTELERETIISVLKQADDVKIEFLQGGNSIMDGITKITPRVSGSWIGSSAKFDPQVHKKKVDMELTSRARKKLDEEVGIEVLGVKNSGAYIGLVTDTSTRLTDDTITPNEDIRIEGDKIKIVPEEELGNELGVFFISEDGTEYPVTRILTENNPKKLVARVPALPAGEYTLRIITRFSAPGTLLNNPRAIDYERKLIVS